MKAMLRRTIRAVPLLAVVVLAQAQVIEYEANGQKYQTLTRDGLTVIVTHMPNHIEGFALIQVSIANGSAIYKTVEPEGFSYVRQGAAASAISADQVVDLMLDHGSHGDVVKLVTSYEASLYAIPHMRATNGYEQRRQNSMSMGLSAKLQAAATASAIALSKTRISPGQSTDGAVFIPLNRDMKGLTGGRILFRVGDDTFEFNPD